MTEDIVAPDLPRLADGRIDWLAIEGLLMLVVMLGLTVFAFVESLTR